MLWLKVGLDLLASFFLFLFSFIYLFIYFLEGESGFHHTPWLRIWSKREDKEKKSQIRLKESTAQRECLRCLKNWELVAHMGSYNVKETLLYGGGGLLL